MTPHLGPTEARGLRGEEEYPRAGARGGEEQERGAHERGALDRAHPSRQGSMGVVE